MEDELPRFPDVGSETEYTEPGNWARVLVIGSATTRSHILLTLRVLEVLAGDFRRGEVFEAQRLLTERAWSSRRYR